MSKNKTLVQLLQRPSIETTENHDALGSDEVWRYREWMLPIHSQSICIKYWLT